MVWLIVSDRCRCYSKNYNQPFYLARIEVFENIAVAPCFSGSLKEIIPPTDNGYFLLFSVSSIKAFKF